MTTINRIDSTGSTPLWRGQDDASGYNFTVFLNFTFLTFGRLEISGNNSIVISNVIAFVKKRIEDNQNPDKGEWYYYISQDNTQSFDLPQSLLTSG